MVVVVVVVVACACVRVLGVGAAGGGRVISLSFWSRSETRVHTCRRVVRGAQKLLVGARACVARVAWVGSPAAGTMAGNTGGCASRSKKKKHKEVRCLM